jgi:DNA-binding transcriptional regulator YdaS (Cro superfamily)
MSYEPLMQHFKTPAALVAALRPFGCSITPQAIYKWRGAGVPLDKAPLIEVASGGAVQCEQLRADVRWIRDAAGNVTAYRIDCAPAKKKAV